MQLKKMMICSLVLITAVLGGCSRNEKLSAPAATENFGFSVLKVGQADAIIMQTANNCVIIDCGEKGDGKKILEYLEENKITSVSKLFITHFDKDHVGGAAKVINNVNVEEIVTPCYKGTSGEYENFLSAAESKGLSPFEIDENRSFILDDVLFEVFPPQKKTYKEGDNDFSLLISVTHGKNRFLFTGDAEEERTAEILKTVKGEYTFLKVPHHGRFNQKTEALINSIKPRYAVITDSEKNPAEEATLNALEGSGCRVYETKNGDVFVSSGGEDIEIKQ